MMAASKQQRLTNSRNSIRCFCLLFLGAMLVGSLLLWAQAPPETVGRIYGEDIQVHGPSSVEVEGGFSVTVLASGSNVTVRSGQARLLLAEGGEVGICGPARFSVLKSGGAITLAIDYGRVHAKLENASPLTFYTPLIVASPVAIASGPRDVTVGLDQSGAMCVLAARGAVRIEQQLTGHRVLLPQGGELSLAGEQIESMRGASGSCQCEVLVARSQPLEQVQPPQLSLLASAASARLYPPAAEYQTAPQDTQKPPTIEEPVYQVVMPPLTFDAASPAPPPQPSPETILLLRQARVRPVKVFRGRVEEPPAPPAPLVAVQKAEVIPLLEQRPAKKEASMLARIRNFFRRLTSRGPCAGAGCA